MRTYRVVRLVDGYRMRWAVVSVSVRGDDTWDVIQSFETRREAIEYVGAVQVRQAELKDAGLP